MGANDIRLARLGLSAAEVAELLGISRRHVWKLLASGRLPEPIRLGRSVRWLRDDLLAHLEGLKTQ
jgi:excisionase family DNA binding protein